MTLARTAERTPDRLRTRAFGLDLDCGFELAGLSPGPAGPPSRPVRIELAARSDLEGLLPAALAGRLTDVTTPDGRSLVTIDAGGKRGYRFWAEGFGEAWLSADGAAVMYAPPDEPAWRWQRYLTGQVLPFAAVLRGLEVFHSSAVAVRGRAVAMVGGSGSGKTSLALELAVRGLPFVSDDVLVLEPTGDGVLAHPGVGLANVRSEAAELAGRVCASGLGHRLGQTREEVRVALPQRQQPLPLAAMFFLQRGAHGDRATVERLSPVDPRLLLAGTFNLVLRERARLVRQLDLAARLATSAAMFRIDCPPGVGAQALAARVLEAVETVS